METMVYEKTWDLQYSEEYGDFDTEDRRAFIHAAIDTVNSVVSDYGYSVSGFFSEDGSTWTEYRTMIY